MMRLGLIVPFYNHEHAIRQTVAALKVHGLRMLAGRRRQRRALRARCSTRSPPHESGWLTLIRCPVNRGKGIAVLTGFTAAHAAGCTHALQIDADGQHDFAAIPRMAELARANPDGHHHRRAGVRRRARPPSRRIGRKLTTLWVRINTLSTRIEDAMCGFRVYPLAADHARSRSARQFRQPHGVRSRDPGARGVGRHAGRVDAHATSPIPPTASRTSRCGATTCAFPGCTRGCSSACCGGAACCSRGACVHDRQATRPHPQHHRQGAVPRSRSRRHRLARQLHQVFRDRALRAARNLQLQLRRRWRAPATPGPSSTCTCAT